MYVKPSSRASARATVDLPAPAGPSIATTICRAAGGAASRSRMQPGDVVDEPRVGHGRRVHADDLDALARRQTRDRAHHRQAMVAARVDRAAAQTPGAPHHEAVLTGLDVTAERAQTVDHARDPVGLL